jgi:hypothetical protein
MDQQRICCNLSFFMLEKRIFETEITFEVALLDSFLNLDINCVPFQFQIRP